MNDVELEKGIAYLRAYSDRIQAALEAAGIDLNATDAGACAFFTTEETAFFRGHGIDPAALAKGMTEAEVVRFKQGRTGSKPKRELTAGQVVWGAKMGVTREQMEKYLKR